MLVANFRNSKQKISGVFSTRVFSICFLLAIILLCNPIDAMAQTQSSGENSQTGLGAETSIPAEESKQEEDKTSNADAPLTEEDIKKAEIEALAKCLADATDLDACAKANEDLKPEPVFTATVGLPTLESIDDDLDPQNVVIETDDVVTPSITQVKEEIAVTVDIVILFDFDSARIKESEREKLNSIAEALQQPAALDKSFAVVGHTDSLGTDLYNCILSTRRAEAIVNRLITSGVEAKRLEAFGAGEFLLKDQQNDESEVNRRAAFITKEIRNNGAIGEIAKLCD